MTCLARGLVLSYFGLSQKPQRHREAVVSSMMEAEPLTTTIDRDGDLLLELEDNGLKRLLLVSSETLALASSVFDRMSKFLFKEGLAGHPKDSLLRLPDDKLMHSQSSVIPYTINHTPSTIQNFARTYIFLPWIYRYTVR